MKQARAAKSSTSADIVINITGRAMASDLLLVLVLLLSSITECKSRIKTVINGIYSTVAVFVVGMLGNHSLKSQLDAIKGAAMYYTCSSSSTGNYYW